MIFVELRLSLAYCLTFSNSSVTITKDHQVVSECMLNNGLYDLDEVATTIIHLVDM